MLPCKIDLPRLKNALLVATKALCCSFGSFNATIACNHIKKMAVECFHSKHSIHACERASDQSIVLAVGRHEQVLLIPASHHTYLVQERTPRNARARTHTHTHDAHSHILTISRRERLLLRTSRGAFAFLNDVVCTHERPHERQGRAHKQIHT